jgi:hypothetical protein
MIKNFDETVFRVRKQVRRLLFWLFDGQDARDVFFVGSINFLRRKFIQISQSFSFILDNWFLNNFLLLVNNIRSISVLFYWF